MSPPSDASFWQDEFNQPAGAGPDPAKWSHDLGNDGWGNGELENYVDSRDHSFVADDAEAENGKALVIRATRDAWGNFVSARIKTQGKFTLTGGRIEARLKLPRGQGIWPAFWMLGESLAHLGWPACGELDIMEVIGSQPGRLHSTIHGPSYCGPHGLTQSIQLPAEGSFSDAYHVFSVDWSPGKIQWSLDGLVYHTRTPVSLPPGARWVFDDTRFFLILNLAVGGQWPGNPDATTQFPQELRVDYVRVSLIDQGSQGPRR